MSYQSTKTLTDQANIVYPIQAMLDGQLHTVAFINALTHEITYLRPDAENDPVIQETINSAKLQFTPNSRIRINHNSQSEIRIQTDIGELYVSMEPRESFGYDKAYIGFAPKLPDGQIGDNIDLMAVRVAKANYPNHKPENEMELTMSAYLNIGSLYPEIETNESLETIYQELGIS